MGRERGKERFSYHCFVLLRTRKLEIGAPRWAGGLQPAAWTRRKPRRGPFLPPARGCGVHVTPSGWDSPHPQGSGRRVSSAGLSRDRSAPRLSEPVASKGRRCGHGRTSGVGVHTHTHTHMPMHTRQTQVQPRTYRHGPGHPWAPLLGGPRNRRLAEGPGEGTVSHTVSNAHPPSPRAL